MDNNYASSSPFYVININMITFSTANALTKISVSVQNWPFFFFFFLTIAKD